MRLKFIICNSLIALISFTCLMPKSFPEAIETLNEPDIAKSAITDKIKEAEDNTKSVDEKMLIHPKYNCDPKMLITVFPNIDPEFILKGFPR